MLHYVEVGADHGGAPLILGHGLYGSARNWGSIAKRLGQRRHVITFDQRNHGQSPWFDSHRYSDMAEDLSQLIAAKGGVADVMGHSMGGKAAMILALNAPERVRRLMVADIAPVTYTHDQSQHIRTMKSLTPEELGDRQAARGALKAKTQDHALAAFFAQSIDFERQEWRLNLEVLEEFMPDILGFPTIESKFEKPALFLSGANSDYVKAEYRSTIKALFPRAHFAKLSGAGHWLHAEKPKEFIATVQGFFGDGA